MGTITVAIDAESIFTWDGDEAAVKHVLEDFPHDAASAGMTPRALADNCALSVLAYNILRAINLVGASSLRASLA